MGVVFLKNPPLFLVGVFMATPGLFHELKLLRWSDGGSRGMQDQDARSRGVVQARPGQLDLLQLAQDTAAEEFDGLLVAGFVRVHSELAVHLPPGEP